MKGLARMSQPERKSTQYLQLVTTISFDEWQLLCEAGERCGLGPSDYILMAALAAARTIVPAASQAPLVETPMPGLFDEGGEE